MLNDFVGSIKEFSSWNHAERIRFFAWFLHSKGQRNEFQPADIRRMFSELHLAPPASLSSFMAAMVRRKEALRSKLGYRLEKRTRDAFEAKYGDVSSTVRVRGLLESLPARVSDLATRAYLNETLTCFRHGAFRASVVMAWNLAYDHLCQRVLVNSLREFNAQLPKSFSKADINTIVKRDDFSELKESQVLQVCRSANITSSSLHKVLKEKLDRRNVAAHPSGVIITQATAEDCISDLIENVVLVV